MNKIKYDKNNPEHLLLNPVYAPMIINGEKTKEFRKESKNIKSGIKYFFSNVDFSYLFKAHLKWIALNPELTKYFGGDEYDDIDDEEMYNHFFVINGIHNNNNVIDDSSYKFVNESYIDKNINFVVYGISNVKGASNE